MNGVAHFSAWGILRGGHQAEGADFHRALKECMDACGFEHLDGGREPFELKVI